jgi:chromosome segregation ATPase
MAMAAGASPQPPRDLADSLRAHPLPDALQPGQRPVDSREVEKLAAGERSLLDAQRQIATLQSGRDAMKEQNERLQREVLDAQRQIATLQSGRDAMKEENERLQREVLDAQRQIATLQSGRDAMKEQDERLQREVLALTKENAEMQTAQTEAQTHGEAGIRSLQLDLDKAASRNGVLQGKLQELIVEKVKLTKGSEALKGKLAEAEQRAEALKETSAQAKQIPAMRKELATANGKLKAVVDQYRTLSVKAKGHEAAAKEYLDQKMALEAKLASAQKVPPAAFLAARKEAAEFKARAGILTKKLQGLAGLDQKTFADLKEKNTELEKAVEAKKSDAARLTRLEIENRILKDKVTELMR